MYRYRFALVSLLPLCAGCETYEPLALEPEAVMAGLLAERQQPESHKRFGLDEAYRAMRARNERVVLAFATYREEAAVAGIATPMANPSVFGGPSILDGSGITSSNRYGWQAILGWALPLSGRRSLRDDVHKLKEHVAFAQAVGTMRREYLGLREDFVRLAFAQRLALVRQTYVETTRREVDTVKRMVETRGATALDQRRAELEHERAKARELAQRERMMDEVGRISRRCGLGHSAVAGHAVTALGGLPERIPSLAQLQELLLEEPGLQALRAEYLLTEKELQLEVARQYPDLELGPDFERVENVNKWGLFAGIPLPIFDRNQQGIARGKARRESLRDSYTARMRQKLGEVEEARTRLQLRQKRWQLMNEKVVALSAQIRRLASQTLDAGGIDALHLLELIRQQAEVGIEVLSAEADLYDGWVRLEAACGAPLLDLPGAPKADATRLPAANEKAGKAGKNEKADKAEKTEKKEDAR